MSNLTPSERALKNKGRFYIICTALLWGLAGVCVKSITWNSMTISFARSLLSFTLFGIVRGSFRLKFKKINILGGIIGAATGILYVMAIKLTTAGTAIILQYVAPILVFLYMVIFRHRKARPAEWILTLVVFGGCVLSFSDSMDFSHLLGNILALLSGVTFAAQILITAAPECDSDDTVMMGSLVTVLFAAPFAVSAGVPDLSVSNILWILVMGFIQIGLSNILFARGVKLVDEVECSLLLTLEPIFNPIPVAIFCHEMMGSRAIIGAVIVLAGVTLYSILPKKEAPPAENDPS